MEIAHKHNRPLSDVEFWHHANTHHADEFNGHSAGLMDARMIHLMFHTFNGQYRDVIKKSPFYPHAYITSVSTGRCVQRTR